MPKPTAPNTKDVNLGRNIVTHLCFLKVHILVVIRDCGIIPGYNLGFPHLAAIVPLNQIEYGVYEKPSFYLVKGDYSLKLYERHDKPRFHFTFFSFPFALPLF